MSEVEKAATTVLRAMHALDAHRHETAPTLEREYLAALEAYFVTAERAAGRERTADGEAGSEPDADDLAELDDDARIEELRADRSSILGHYAAARRALRLARRYAGEPGSSGRRERECVAAAMRHRAAIRALRARLAPPVEQLLLPGLAKTRPQVAETQRIARSG
jgi:hypothetical protein